MKIKDNSCVLGPKIVAALQLRGIAAEWETDRFPHESGINVPLPYNMRWAFGAGYEKWGGVLEGPDGDAIYSLDFDMINSDHDSDGEDCALEFMAEMMGTHSIRWMREAIAELPATPKRQVRVLVALGPAGLENVITDADDLDIEVVVADFADDDEVANDWEGLKVVAGEDGDTPRYAQVETMGAAYDADSITAIENAPEYEPGDNNDDEDADPDEDEEGGHD